MERNVLNNLPEIHFYPDIIPHFAIFGDGDNFIYGDSISIDDYNLIGKEDNVNDEQKVDLSEPKDIIQSTLKLTDNKDTAITEKKEKKEKKISFRITKYLQRGKKGELNPNKKIHSWDSYDLVQRKLQVHYLNYLIQLANDCINALNKNIDIQFSNILYDEKKKVFKRKKKEKLKYKDIFKFHISNKNKGKILPNDTNEKKYLLICDKSSILKEFFELSYLKVFEEYYYANKRMINFNGLNILLSDETKTFNNLLTKGRNGEIESRFLFIVDKFYFKIYNE